MHNFASIRIGAGAALGSTRSVCADNRREPDCGRDGKNLQVHSAAPVPNADAARPKNTPCDARLQRTVLIVVLAFIAVAAFVLAALAAFASAVLIVVHARRSGRRAAGAHGAAAGALARGRAAETFRRGRIRAGARPAGP